VQGHKPILALLSIALAIGLGIARGQSPQARSPLVVLQRVDLKMSATGQLLGWLGSGARVEELDEGAGWVRVQVRGWMPTRSLRTSGDETRIAPLEETLRVAPSGRVFGGLQQDVEVRTLQSSGGWSEVTMIGWVPSRSVTTALEPLQITREPESAPGCRGGRRGPKRQHSAYEKLAPMSLGHPVWRSASLKTTPLVEAGTIGERGPGFVPAGSKVLRRGD
jgi:hypothetical protein